MNTNMKNFIANVKHDKGVMCIFTKATTKRQARIAIMKVENCPMRAIKLERMI